MFKYSYKPCIDLDSLSKAEILSIANIMVLRHADPDSITELVCRLSDFGYDVLDNGYAEVGCTIDDWGPYVHLGVFRQRDIDYIGEPADYGVMLTQTGTVIVYRGMSGDEVLFSRNMDEEDMKLITPMLTINTQNHVVYIDL